MSARILVGVVSNLLGVAAAYASDLYWTQFSTEPATTGAIGRANVDSLTPEAVIPTGLVSPYRIAYDSVEQKIYWTSKSGSASSQGLRRCNLDGSAVETVVPLGGLGWARQTAITVDEANRKVYWASNGSTRPGIYRANLDGTEPERIYENSDRDALIQDCAIDYASGRLVFTDSGGSFVGVKAINLDGSGFTRLVACATLSDWRSTLMRGDSTSADWC